jgi:manganese transport protein
MRRRVLGIFGPATVVSVAYIDPGNFGSNISSGSIYGLDLLWVVWVSSIIAMLLQYLSGKLGILTGRSVVDLTLERLNNHGMIGRVLSRLYTISLFAVVIATDMAEFIGITLGLHLLTGIPLLFAALLAVVDILILFALTDRKGKLEMLIGSLVAIIGFSYVIQLSIIAPDPNTILEKSFTPTLNDNRQVMLAASILGATVSPQALMLHGYLTADRWNGVKEKIKRHIKETIVYLSIATLINASLQVAAYGAFYSRGIEVTDIDEAYHTLKPLYGSFAANAFGIALLASGISSSLVSVVTGQRVIESVRGKRIEQWKVRLSVRLVNMIPLLIALLVGVKAIDILVYSQVVLSLMLPFIAVPLVVFASNIGLINTHTKVASVIATVFIVMLNIILLLYDSIVH